MTRVTVVVQRKIEHETNMFWSYFRDATSDVSNYSLNAQLMSSHGSFPPFRRAVGSIFLYLYHSASQKTYLAHLESFFFIPDIVITNYLLIRCAAHSERAAVGCHGYIPTE